MDFPVMFVIKDIFYHEIGKDFMKKKIVEFFN